MAVRASIHRSRAGILIAALIALFTSIGPAVQNAYASSFTMYNQTQGDWPNWALEQYGLTDNAVVYDAWGLTCSTTGCSNVPSQSTFESIVQSDVSSKFEAGSTAPLVLDFENIVPVSATSSAQAQQDLTLYEELATWAHDAEPSAPIGIYSYDYKTTYTSYTQQLYTGGFLQFFAPSMYNRWSTVSTWESELSDAVTNDHAIDSSLPIYPYIWPQWDNGSSSGQLTGSDWTTEVSDVESQTQGAIVWANASTTLGSTSCGWLGDLAYEMSELAGTESSGPLTITANVPNTCEVTSGSTTSVPLTITNDGTSTSAATTLQTASGPQAISETYSATSIPALAAGASWTTTLSITVPSSATDQTALLKINYGTGYRWLTVIIT